MHDLSTVENIIVTISFATLILGINIYLNPNVDALWKIASLFLIMFPIYPLILFFSTFLSRDIDAKVKALETIISIACLHIIGLGFLTFIGWLLSYKFTHNIIGSLGILDLTPILIFIIFELWGIFLHYWIHQFEPYFENVRFSCLIDFDKPESKIKKLIKPIFKVLFPPFTILLFFAFFIWTIFINEYFQAGLILIIGIFNTLILYKKINIFFNRRKSKLSSEFFEEIKKEPNKDYFLSYLLEDVVKQTEEDNVDFDQKINLLKGENDPFHQITLNYVLWRKDKKYDNAKKVIELLKDVIKDTFCNGWFNLSNFCVEMLFRICRETNQKDDFVIKWIKGVFTLIFKHEEKIGIIHIMKQCEILLKSIIRLQNVEEFKDEINLIDNILDKNISKVEKEENYHFQRSLIELKIEFNKLVEKDILKLKKEIVLSFEKEGDKKVKDKNYLAANWFYNDALTAAKNFGLKEYYEELKKKLIDAGSKIEFKEIKVEIDLKPLIKFKLDQYKESKKPLEDSLKDDSLIVTQKMIEDVQSSQSTSLASLIPKVSINEQGINIASSKETQAIEKAQSILLAESLSKILRVKVMNYILDQIGIDGLLKVIKSQDFLNENTVALIEYGFIKIKNDDFISATHILTPKIESVLRDIITNKLKLSGIRFRRYGGGYEYITLGSILKGELLKEEENSKIEEYLGKDFREYLYYKLIMSEGENLRDDLSHGILKKEKMNYEMCLDLLYIITRIIVKE